VVSTEAEALTRLLLPPAETIQMYIHFILKVWRMEISFSTLTIEKQKNIEQLRVDARLLLLK